MRKHIVVALCSLKLKLRLAKMLEARDRKVFVSLSSDGRDLAAQPRVWGSHGGTGCERGCSTPGDIACQVGDCVGLVILGIGQDRY